MSLLNQENKLLQVANHSNYLLGYSSVLLFSFFLLLSVFLFLLHCFLLYSVTYAVACFCLFGFVRVWKMMSVGSSGKNSCEHLKCSPKDPIES